MTALKSMGWKLRGQRDVTDMGIKSKTFIPACVKSGFIIHSGNHFGATGRRKQNEGKSAKYPFLACGFERDSSEFRSSERQ
jgi:hypothetical protein